MLLPSSSSAASMLIGCVVFLMVRFPLMVQGCAFLETSSLNVIALMVKAAVGKESVLKKSTLFKCRTNFSFSTDSLISLLVMLFISKIILPPTMALPS